MAISEAQLYEILARLEKNHGRTVLNPPANAVEDEIEEIHQPILKWARGFIPFVPIIYHRPDKKSGLKKGVHDLTVFYKRHAICGEAKSDNGKIRPDQVVWKLAMEHQGFPVHIWHNPEEFFDIIRRIDAEEKELSSLNNSGGRMINPKSPDG